MRENPHGQISSEDAEKCKILGLEGTACRLLQQIGVVYFCQVATSIGPYKSSGEFKMRIKDYSSQIPVGCTLGFDKQLKK